MMDGHFVPRAPDPMALISPRLLAHDDAGLLPGTVRSSKEEDDRFSEDEPADA
jgi:hypothetical protein